jgi:CheY-like chemotaxis protein
LHRTYVCDVERGARNVTLQSIEKLARALEISVSTLLAYPREPLPQGTRSEEFVTGGLVDILYVEDNPVDVGLATDGLKHITNRIHVVRDGLAALHFLFGTGEYANRRTRPNPQLILLDLGLPKVDGLEVLRRVKADPRTSGIPVIVLTASVRDRDLQASKRLGAEAYIIKPVDLQNLSRVTPQLNLQWALWKPAAPVQPQQESMGLP